MENHSKKPLLLMDLGRGKKQDIKSQIFKKSGYMKMLVRKKQTDINREINPEQRSGMYYSEAHFVFCFDADIHRVYLSMHYGPRYARGILLELKQEGNKLSLCNDEILWVS